MRTQATQSFPVLRAVLRVGVRQALRELWVTGEIRGGRMVGRDAYGNEYYEMLAAPDDKAAQDAGWPVKDERLPFYRKRYVLPKGGLDEASLVPPEWHGWLHNSVDEHPTKAIQFSNAEQKGEKHTLPQSDGSTRTIWPWQTPRHPNATGTPQRYVPYATVRPHITPFTGKSQQSE